MQLFHFTWYRFVHSALNNVRVEKTIPDRYLNRCKMHTETYRLAALPYFNLYVAQRTKMLHRCF